MRIPPASTRTAPLRPVQPAIPLSLLLLVLLLLSAPSPAQHPGPDTKRHDFGNVDWAVKAFEHPSRDRWQKPDQVVRALHLRGGQVVADIGAGTGYFSRRLARAVGPTGRVLALEVEPSLVRYMADRALREHQKNLEARLIAPDDPHLAPGSVDLVLVVDTLHHIQGRFAYYKKIQAALQPGGRLAIVDFRAVSTPVGPPAAMRIPVRTLRAELEAAGFVIQESPISCPTSMFLSLE